MLGDRKSKSKWKTDTRDRQPLRLSGVAIRGIIFVNIKIRGCYQRWFYQIPGNILVAIDPSFMYEIPGILVLNSLLL